jgi:molybdopterin molybdotransferase
MGLLAVDEALERVLSGTTPTASETVPLLDAQNRVLAEDLAAKLTQPPFAASAMDGYAMRARDIESTPVTLEMIGTSAAGEGFSGTVGAGQTVRIFTGAPMPAGADTVVIQENTDAKDRHVLVREAPRPEANVRQRGIDFQEGQTLLKAGRTLDAHALTLAAAMGWADVPVRKRPSVAILATGNELVPPGTKPGPDQIVSSNPVGIAALTRAAGGEARLLGIATDNVADIEAKIADAKNADILVTIGGASVGDHDLVSAALEAQGMKLEFWKVALRPGKPFLFGRIGSTRVLGLPGNPASTLICAHVFLVPLLRAFLGAEVVRTPRERATVTHPLEKNGPRLHLLRARLADGPTNNPEVNALGSQDSSLLSVFAAADCLIVRRPDAPAIPAGSEVEIERL